MNGISGLRGATIDGLQLAMFGPLLAEELGIDVDES